MQGLGKSEREPRTGQLSDQMVVFTLIDPLIEHKFFLVPRKYLSKTHSVSGWGQVVPLLWVEERAKQH